MTDHTDRGEELRGLSFAELLERTVEHRRWMTAVQNEPRLGAPSDFRKGAEIQAEWDRRCAEREAEKAELEELRQLRDSLLDLMAQSEGVAGYHLNGDVAEWDWIEKTGLLVVPQPQEASEGQEGDRD